MKLAITDRNGQRALPDRITVLTCIGCGAMGRQERCDGDCAEHKLVLVGAAEHDALPAAAHAARERVSRLAPVARALVASGDAQAVLPRLRTAARRALREAPRVPTVPEPDAVTGWWCDRCGNVDLPQPCIGVCVWQVAEWVNLERYDHDRALAAPHLDAAARLSSLLERVAAVTPRAGQWQRTLAAFQDEARAVLAL